MGRKEEDKVAEDNATLQYSQGLPKVNSPCKVAVFKSQSPGKTTHPFQQSGVGCLVRVGATRGNIGSNRQFCDMLRVGDAILDKTHTPYVAYDFFSWNSRLEEDEAAEDKAVLIDKVPTPENPNPQPQAPKPKPEH